MSLHNDIDILHVVDNRDARRKRSAYHRNRSSRPRSSRTEGDALTKVISIANQKGGVGKTTCSINLGGALAERGYRVLCVDMDPQANLTVGLGISSDVRVDGRRPLRGSVALDEIVRETETQGLWVAPATLELASTEVELFTAIGREMVLRDALAGWADRQFDVVIIDCPPTLGLLTINSLVASSRVIIPVQTQYYAIWPDRADQGHQHDQDQAQPRPRGARPAADVLRRADRARARDARESGSSSAIIGSSTR